jgi:hypothetical protein
MQYEIALPADYDMGVIRRRVAEKGPLTDDFPGLELKAYLVRDRGVEGAVANQYAPFYVWADAAGMNRFLWGPGFHALCASFGRPRVQHWLGVAHLPGPAAAFAPASATRRLVPLDPDDDAGSRVTRAQEELEVQSRLPGVHQAALLVDPRGWELAYFTPWQGAAPESAGTRYRALHLSRPRTGGLPHGPQP